MTTTYTTPLTRTVFTEHVSRPGYTHTDGDTLFDFTRRIGPETTSIQCHWVSLGQIRFSPHRLSVTERVIVKTGGLKTSTSVEGHMTVEVWREKKRCDPETCSRFSSSVLSIHGPLLWGSLFGVGYPYLQLTIYRGEGVGHQPYKTPH